ncbi:MAG: PKD domain-containing protein, partial [Thermoplasmatota archaeon]
LSPEMSDIKNPSESTFGNDTVPRYGAEVRRIILHQTDLAQPYVLWQPGTTENNSEILPYETVSLVWQVNGSLVVDHTYVQWGRNPDPINNPEYFTTDHDEHAGGYYGGTGWDNAESGSTNGVKYTESIVLTQPGDYYFVAKAQVDQIYANVLRPDVYKNNPYLRIIKERTNDSYYEELEGSDGTEKIFGQTWWYSPVLHVKVLGGAPEKPEKPSGPTSGKIGAEYTYTTSTVDPDNDQVYYKWSWGDGTTSDWLGPYDSGETVTATHTWTTKGTYSVRVKAKDQSGQESDWSDPLSVSMPRNRLAIKSLLQFLLEQIRTFTQSMRILK